MNIFNKKIDEAKTICILGHKNPDGDCIGAALSIYNYILNKYGDNKKVKIYLTEFSSRFNILPNIDKISSLENDATIYDLVIVVDAGSTDRFEDFKRYFDEAKDKIVVDHHENNTLPCSVSIVDETSIATCEILYEQLEKEFIDKNVATCLFTGLATDSGVFRYRDVSKKTFNIAGELLKFDINIPYLLDTIVFDNTIQQRKAQGIAFERLKLLNKGKVSYSYILKDELDNLNLNTNEIDNIIVYLREINNIVVAAFAYPIGHNIYKFSLRSKSDNINISEFARLHEGGGHKLAAGCVYYGDINTVSTNFEKDIKEFIDGKIS